jgi:hypothetical protein
MLNDVPENKHPRLPLDLLGPGLPVPSALSEGSVRKIHADLTYANLLLGIP